MACPLPAARRWAAVIGALAAACVPAHAADRWWTYIGGCGSADWLGTVGGANSQARLTCWSTAPGGLSGAPAPTLLDNVHFVNTGATATLLTTFADPSRASFSASAASIEMVGSASFAVGLTVNAQSLAVTGTTTVGRDSNGQRLLGRLDVSGGSFSTGALALVAGQVNLGSGTLAAASAQLGSGTLLQTGGTFGAGSLSLAAGAAGGSTLQQLGGSATTGDLLLTSSDLNRSAALALGGTGTRFSATNDSVVAQHGAASITVADGAALATVRTTLAANAGSAASVIIDRGGRWDVSDYLAVSGGSATVNIGANGMLATQATLLGNAAGGHGTLNVAGLGASWIDASRATIGQYERGTVNVSQGATVSTKSVILGDDANAKGSVTLGDAGSTWTSGTLLVGNFGGGSFTIGSGAALTTTGNATLGSRGGASGSVIVGGAGATWLSKGTLRIGDQGTGLLQIAAGGWVDAASLAIGSAGTLWLDGGELRLPSFTTATGGQFRWTAGTLSITGPGAVLGEGLPALLRLGSGQTLKASDEILLPAGSVLLLDGGTVVAARAKVSGGAIVGTAAGKLDLTPFDLFGGHGSVAVAVAGGRADTRLLATGTWSLGDLARSDGFAFGGVLEVGTQQVLLNDADLAELGGRITLEAGGRLASVNGIHLGADGVLTAAGSATVQGRFVNEGAVLIDGGTLTFVDAVEGRGTFGGAIAFAAGYAPGDGSGAVDFGGGEVAFGPQATLRLAVGAERHDLLTNIGALNFDGMLALSFSAMPVAGTRYDLLDFQSFGGTLDARHVTVTGFDAARIDFSHLASDGSITISAVPEAPPAVLWAGGLALLVLRRRAVALGRMRHADPDAQRRRHGGAAERRAAASTTTTPASTTARPAHSSAATRSPSTAMPSSMPMSGVTSV
jgi:T5SS/PEP-CTERM-associated repeat protein